MAGKPRVTVRLEPSMVKVLAWYAEAREIPEAELAAELIGDGLLTALVDADLRAAITAVGGPPPDVPLAATRPGPVFQQSIQGGAE